MIVIARLKKRAIHVHGGVQRWFDTWPDWARAHVLIKDICKIEALVSGGGCVIIEDHGYMSTADFDRRFMEVEE